MKLSEVKTIFERKMKRSERSKLLKRLQSMISERTEEEKFIPEKERGGSYYGYLCDKGTCFESGV